MLEKLISSSRTTEVDTVSQKIDGAYTNASLSGDANLVRINTELKTKTEKLAASIKRSKAESVLDEKDEVRDNKVRAVYYLLFGLLYYPESEIKTAAQVVMNEFEKYGLAVVKESYVVETSHVSSMLSDFTKPKIQTVIALLPGIAELIAELDAAETDFEQTSIAYEAEKAKDGSLENATTLKKEVLVIINERLVVYLRAMEMVNAATYGDFAATVAQIINDSNAAVKKRRNKNKDN